MEKKKKNKNVCAVAICSSPNDASYHKFPKDPNLRSQWLQACKRLDPVNVKNFKKLPHFNRYLWVLVGPTMSHSNGLLFLSRWV